MIKLFDSAFSPFARKVRMVLEHKGLAFEALDGLLKSNHAALEAVNGRIEVPVLVDDDLIVVNSADIVAYLEFRYPAKPVIRPTPAARVHARAWERAADAFIDAVLDRYLLLEMGRRARTHARWAARGGARRSGLVYDALERELAGREFVSGPCRSPTSRSSRTSGEREGDGGGVLAKAHPNLARWFKHMRALPICAADLRRARDFVVDPEGTRLRAGRIFWRGDRIEWMLARGFHDWFFKEIAQDRVPWPGPELPAPLRPHSP